MSAQPPSARKSANAKNNGSRSKKSQANPKSNGSKSRLSKGVFSSRSDEWGTPKAVFKVLDREFGFTLDVAASKSNAKCKKYFTHKDDGLSKDWEGTVWCNPPYSNVSDWMRKAEESARFNEATVVCLVPARTSTNWWRDFTHLADEVRFIDGRLKFVRPNGKEGKSAPFPSAVVIFRPPARQPAVSIMKRP